MLCASKARMAAVKRRFMGGMCGVQVHAGQAWEKKVCRLYFCTDWCPKGAASTDRLRFPAALCTCQDATPVLPTTAFGSVPPVLADARHRAGDNDTSAGSRSHDQGARRR